MKKIFFSILALFLPFLAFLFNDEPGKAVLALILQGFIIGWPIATIWAFKECVFAKNDNNKA